ncbi:hypothetical protein CLOM_g6144 [Closterium sp. NIES-68]|nr:hypothetical protein CLOM_g6144 [Closterium sp. NIES-68]
MPPLPLLHSRVSCALCPSPAAVHCAADGAHLCVACDQAVHVANALVMKHARALLCCSCHQPTHVQLLGFPSAPILPPVSCHGCRASGFPAAALLTHATAGSVAADVSLAHVASAPFLGVQHAGFYPAQLVDDGRGWSAAGDHSHRYGDSQPGPSMQRIESHYSGDSGPDGASPASGVTTVCCEPAVGVASGNTGNSYDLQSVFREQLSQMQQAAIFQPPVFVFASQQHHDRPNPQHQPAIPSDPSKQEGTATILHLFPQIPEDVGLRKNGAAEALRVAGEAGKPSVKRRRTESGSDGSECCVPRGDVADVANVNVNGEAIIGDNCIGKPSGTDRKRTLFESHQQQPPTTRQLQPSSTSDGPALGQTAAARLKRVLQSWCTRLHLATSSAQALAFHMLQRILRKLRPTDVAADALRVVLATCLWVAIKAQESQGAVPRASQIAAVARVTADALVGMEIEVLKLLDWRPLEGFHVDGEK